MNKLVASLVCLASTSAAIAQQTIVVGPGQSFTAIAPAVAAALAGDTVLVMPGTYAADFAINKGLQLIGRGAQLEPAPFSLTGLVIENVPAGETCVFAGFSVDDSGGLSGDVTLRVRNCAGPVILRELNQTSLKIWFVGIENSAQVSVAEGVVRTASAVNSTVVFEHIVFDPTLFAGLSVAGGHTAVVGCTVNGGTVGFTGPAINMDGGVLAITRSAVTASAANMPAIMTTEGIIVVDPSSTIGSASGQTIVGNATVVTREFHSLATRYDNLNSVLELENHGIAGQLFVTVMSMPSPQVATPLGLTWVDPFNITIVDAAIYGPSRLYQSSLPLPPLPPGLSVALQSVVFLDTGIGLSTPSLLTIE